MTYSLLTSPATTPSAPVCPSCGVTLEVIPKRKKKCPSCGQYILVRTRPSDRQRVLVSETEAEAIDREWWLKWYPDRYGVSQEEFDSTRDRLVKESDFNRSDRDVVWSILNHRALRAMRVNDWDTLSITYLEQALFLHDEGKDSFTMLQESKRCELRRYLASEVLIGVKILTCGQSSCETCRALTDKIISINDALEQMPIPVKDCAKGWCRCDYGPVLR